LESESSKAPAASTTAPVELWIGTTNKGKLSEFNLLIQRIAPEIKVKSLQDLPSYVQPPENGKTFLENAQIKARSLRSMRPGQWILAEDSGLEVTGLGGLPGVHSARYAGPKASDSENVAKILKMIQLKAVTDKAARFLCTIVAFDPEGKEHQFVGEMKGVIARTPAGQLGFGYDPVFVPEGQTKTLAELGPGYKAINSHRTEAGKQLLAYINSVMVR
jgi:XTP/dITP diphosphohydrolase